jgi:hypothetical protein
VSLLFLRWEKRQALPSSWFLSRQRSALRLRLPSADRLIHGPRRAVAAAREVCPLSLVNLSRFVAKTATVTAAPKGAGAGVPPRIRQTAFPSRPCHTPPLPGARGATVRGLQCYGLEYIDITSPLHQDPIPVRRQGFDPSPAAVVPPLSPPPHLHTAHRRTSLPWDGREV